MNLPEDRHPLLYVYLDDDQPERIRSRCVSQGATTILGKWPEHVTFSWMMAIIGLISVITCFFLAIIFLVATTSGHHQGKRSLIAKCERNEHVVQLVHMKNLEDLTVNENATYFVELAENESLNKDTACSLESYLKHTSLPVFLVSISPSKTSRNLTILNELEKNFKNFKTIPFDVHSFFNKTVFANFQNQNNLFLKFLAKVLVSWNVGGTVIDSQVKTLKNFQDVLKTKNKIVTVGTVDENVALISAKRFCHVYIFDILKTITETKAQILKYKEEDIVKAAKKRFCHAKWNCTGIQILSSPQFCDQSKLSDNCTFYMSKSNQLQVSIPSNYSLERLCPLVSALL